MVKPNFSLSLFKWYFDEMGNEGSHLKGLEIEEDATEISDFWVQHQATISDSCNYFSSKGDGAITIFKGEAVLGPLWTTSTPLEKCANNLLKYRHPCIVRYLSSWQQHSTLHLATEYVQPLSQVLGLHTPLQICVGLNNILRALVFLHEKAGMSHNNVCISSIYVTGDGQWKLGGMQYLCSYKEMTPAYLKHARIHRYDKAIDPNESSYENILKVDQYAFAALVFDIIKSDSDDVIPHLNEFKKYCCQTLQNSQPEKRPLLSEVLSHSFFNHNFISIYKFLNFLAIKSEDEKRSFFSNILTHLKQFDEETVAKQLSGLLLSRLAMLDQTARKEVLPFIFKPKNERQQNGEIPGLFSLEIFKEYVKPRIIQLFSVRDIEIRMLLLNHFSKYVQIFSHDELSQHILPELLLGIKDTDDTLVASTLLCLSELVPILGGDTVIGNKRSKLFSDGRPNRYQNQLATLQKNTFIPTKSLSDLTCSEQVLTEDNDSINFEKSIILDERPSPVGGEAIDVESVVLHDNQNNIILSEDDWSDWENNTQNVIMQESAIKKSETLIKIDAKVLPVTEKESNASKSILMQEAAIEAKKNIVDITELDIKNQKISKKEEYDFFADMVPVIEKPTVIDVPEIEMSKEFSSKLNFIPTEDNDNIEDWGEGWND